MYSAAIQNALIFKILSKKKRIFLMMFKDKTKLPIKKKIFGP